MKPHEFQYLLDIRLSGPLTADELAHPDRWKGATAQGVSARLRSMVKRGLICRSTETPVISYDLTERGRGITDA